MNLLQEVMDSIELVTKRKLIFDEGAIKAFATILKRMRKEKGMTQEQLGFEANVPRSSIERIEAGRINPTLSTITALARALGIRPSVLQDFDLPDGDRV